MRFSKYHALGNDYIVIDPAAAPQGLSAAAARRICDRHYGVGADGILYGPLPSERCDVALRIVNPDGSEAEKSGNGLRIFARYLRDSGRAATAPVRIETAGGAVTATVSADASEVAVEMGRVSFRSEVIPVAGPPREVLREPLRWSGAGADALPDLRFCAASVGNPHCVVLLDDGADAEAIAALARRVGPLLETDARFPNRSNVQFMRVLSRNQIAIEIWERGAGYTLASGSSSTAAAAVAYRLGLCDAAITVTMPGGRLLIELGPDYDATMTGPVARICDGRLDAALFAALG